MIVEVAIVAHHGIVVTYCSPETYDWIKPGTEGIISVVNKALINLFWIYIDLVAFPLLNLTIRIIANT